VRVEDISLTGVRFQISGPVRPGSTYAFHAELDGFSLAAPIRITRCKAAPAPQGGGLAYFAGAEFLWESPEAEARLGSWLESRGSDAGQFQGDLKG
jgi:hypothetical protein